jgi:hypothetical protein
LERFFVEEVMVLREEENGVDEVESDDGSEVTRQMERVEDGGLCRCGEAIVGGIRGQQEMKSQEVEDDETREDERKEDVERVDAGERCQRDK